MSGDEGRHAVTVRRIRVGEVVSLSDGLGNIVTGPVASVAGKDSFTVQAADRVAVAPPSPSITVVQALIKGDRMDRAIETLTEAGADRIVPWAAANCVVRWDAKSVESSGGKLRRRALEASKQARRAHFSQVAAMAATPAVVELIAAADLALLLHESAAASIVSAAADAAAATSVVVIVGPEGGLTESELEQLAWAGAVTVRMGPEVMRASTAGTAALGFLMAAAGRWN